MLLILQSHSATPCACRYDANLAQLVEQLIRNEQVVGSSPMVGSKKSPALVSGFFFCIILLCRTCKYCGTHLFT